MYLFIYLVIDMVTIVYNIDRTDMESNLWTNGERKACTQERKSPEFFGEDIRQNSKSEQMNESEMPNYWTISIFSIYH